MGLNNILQFFVPKDRKFFPLFKQHADALTNAADYLVEFFEETDKVKREAIYKRIKGEEKNGDRVVDLIFKELNSSFITPFDREDIQYLTSKIDDIIDYINGSANRGVLYSPRSTSNYFTQMSKLVRAVSYELKIALYELENVTKKGKLFNDVITNVYNLEEEADDLYAAFLRDIFETEKDAIELIKQKDIMQSLENATDKGEDVTDTLKAILVKLA